MLIYNILTELNAFDFVLLFLLEIVFLIISLTIFKQRITKKLVLNSLIIGLSLSIMSSIFVRGNFSGMSYREKVGWPLQYYEIYRPMESDAKLTIDVPDRFNLEYWRFIANTMYWMFFPLAFMLFKSKNKKYQKFLIISVFVFIASTAFLYISNFRREHLMMIKDRSAILQTSKSSTNINALNSTDLLNRNIDSFMETHTYAMFEGYQYQVAICSHILYRYDDKYAYTWLQCYGYKSEDNNDIEKGSGFSTAARLEYQKPDYQIVDFKQPGEGSLYTSDLKKLFPHDLMVHPSNDEIQRLDQDINDKAKAIILLKQKYFELQGYPSNNLPPRSILTEKSDDGLYVAFIQNGSGFPILGAQCFLIRPNNEITKLPNFTSKDHSRDAYFSPKDCNNR